MASNSVVESVIICLFRWWWFRFAHNKNPPFLFSHSIEWRISEEAMGTREGTFRSVYLGRDQGMVSFPLLLVSHFNHLSCVYEKIPKITKTNLKPQDFAGSGVSLLLLSPVPFLPPTTIHACRQLCFLVLFISLLRPISF